ncbi:MAG: hypothetical protein P1P76_07025 [Anaerolineales bacterium]|nr:hypothetical protein [Anaerolineales bacterium]
MLKQPVQVQIITKTHWIRGKVAGGAQGLFSQMNLPTESSVEIESGEISALHRVNQSAEQFSKMWFVKREVLAVLVDSRAGLGPSHVVRAGYTKPFPHRVRIVMEGFELIGEIQTGGRFDFGAFIFEGESIFLPLYDARVQAILFPSAFAEAPAMLFNRKRVEGLSLL